MRLIDTTPEQAEETLLVLRGHVPDWVPVGQIVLLVNANLAISDRGELWICHPGSVDRSRPVGDDGWIEVTTFRFGDEIGRVAGKPA